MFNQTKATIWITEGVCEPNQAFQERLLESLSHRLKIQQQLVALYTRYPIATSSQFQMLDLHTFQYFVYNDYICIIFSWPHIVT